MSDDAKWVEDVKRWYFSSARQLPAAEAEPATDFALGYEAAQPALQARHWPDAPMPGFQASTF